MKTVNKYGLEFAGPRRARRGALKQWLIDLVMIAVAIGLIALIWWLLSLVSRAATCGDVMPLSGLKPELRTAGFGVPEWVAYGVLGTLTMSVLALVAWNVIVGPRPAMEDGEGWADKPVPFEVVDPLAGDGLKPELQTMPSGMTRRDAAEIARAAAAEIELCRRMVDGAMHALSVEDYGDALAGASRRLGQVRVTLRELGMTFDQGGIKA